MSGGEGIKITNIFILKNHKTRTAWKNMQTSLYNALIASY